MITRRDWWIGVALVVLTLLAHALIPRYLPRYEFRVLGEGGFMTRIDRWTGTAEVFEWDDDGVLRLWRRPD